MNQHDAIDLWATLSAEGKAPTAIGQASQCLPNYTVGFTSWIERLATYYLDDLARRNAHFKLVLAPYGGGKTHFLLALGVRALEKKYAIAYVPCGDSVALDRPLDIYREVAKSVRLTSEGQAGIYAVLEATLERKREEIHGKDVPDPDAAMHAWIRTLKYKPYAEPAFARTISAALGALAEGGTDIGDAAIRWLQGEMDTLTPSEMRELRLARVPKDASGPFGRALILSLAQFLPDASVHGLTLLIDEVETLFQVRKGKATLGLLAAIRSLLDVPGSFDHVPLFGVFSATPDVLEELRKYPAVEQRLAVHGAGFEEGNDTAIQLSLAEVDRNHKELLEAIGRKLLDIGDVVKGRPYDHAIQETNANRLATIASERNLDVDQRRLFVKTWVALLEYQSSAGERTFSDDELEGRYVGEFRKIESSEDGGFEP